MMSHSSERIRKIVKKLESGHISVIYNALIELRKKFISPDHVYILRDQAVMKYIVPYIENPKLASVSLSIIGNACLHPCLRNDVIKNDGVKRLVRVLRTSANDSIQNRACRALANIALSTEGLTLIHKHNATPHIVNLLTTTHDKDCKQTAIRALRILGVGAKNGSKIVSEKGVFAICKQLHSEDTDIIRCAVKAVASLTQQCSAECANQVDEAECLKVLVELANQSEESVKQNALKCLGNLSIQSVIAYQLGDAGAIEVFSRVANSDSGYANVFSAVLSLCFCCGEFENNHKIRESNVFPLLLRTLGDDKYSELHENILLSLFFRFYSGDFEVLEECEVIKVLTNLLQVYIGRHRSEFCVNSCDFWEEFEKSEFDHLRTGKNMALRTDPKELKLPKEDAMPDSRFFHMLGPPSPVSSEKSDVYDFRCLSEKNAVPANSDSHCNRGRDSSQSNSKPIFFSKKMGLEGGIEPIFIDSPNVSDSHKGGKRKMSENYHLELPHLPPNPSTSIYRKNKFEKNNLVQNILCLLDAFSTNSRLSAQFAEETCIEVLTDYLTLLPEPEEKVNQILVRLLENWNCFEKLIYYNFFGVLDEKTNPCSDIINCRRCSKLKRMKKVLNDKGSAVANSGFGIGIFSYFLLRGNKRSQLNSIYTFASLVKDKSSLQKLLIDADGLSVLAEFVTSTDPGTFANAVVSLSRIYRCLSNKPRHITEKSPCKKKKNESECQYFSCSHDVSFQLDSGDVVGASRSVLCEKSDFFQALLLGQFSEAHKSLVSLSDVSYAALSAAFHFLHGCSEDSCDFIKRIEFDVLLELLCVLDKYFIFEFKHSVEKKLLNNMDMRKARKIYVSSAKYNFPELAEHAFHFILLADDTEREELLKCARFLLDSAEVNFLGEINYTLKDMFPGSRDHPLYTRRKCTPSMCL